MMIHKWGGLACFLLAGTFLAPLIYFLGAVRATIGPAAYDLADFLYGPVWGASLVMAVFALRECFGEHAPRRMSLALLAATLAAGAMVSVALIRSANREYLAMHPELNESMLLAAWTPLVTGMTAVGHHCMGWSLLLLGSAGWTSRRLPHPLCVLYLLGGIASLFAYLVKDIEMVAVALAVIVSIWQGILLWNADPEATQEPRAEASRPVHA